MKATSVFEDTMHSTGFLSLIPRLAAFRRIGACILLFAFFAVGTASATIDTVTTVTDEDDGNLNPANGTGASFRECVMYSSAGDTIRFDASVVPGTIFLVMGEVTVDHDLVILGPGLSDMAISGAAANRALVINGGTTVMISGLTFYDGYELDGGAISSDGDLDITDCMFRDNNAQHRGGAIRAGSGTLTLDGCTFTRNHAFTNGGAVSTGSADLTASSCRIDNNIASGNGGALDNGTGTATLTGCSLTTNTASVDGGAASATGGSLTLGTCTVEKNTASGAGGGLSIGASATCGVDASTIDANSASTSGGGISNAGTLTITSSTISGNTATNGGGISSSGGSVSTTFATVTSNASASGGGYYKSGGTLTFKNTIVGGNSAGVGSDVTGSVSSSGHNLVSIVDGSSGWVGSDLTGTLATPLNVWLGVLQNNGGPTRTHALLSCSPAVDAADPSGAPSTDQRGYTRSVDGDNHGGAVPDIGAYEAQSQVDITPPIASCLGTFEAVLDGSGHASISYSTISLGSTDDCGIAYIAINDSSWNCSQRGDHNVTLTVRDRSNNQSTCVTVVSVVDHTKPVVSAPSDKSFTNSTGVCGWTKVPASLGTATATDNCHVASITNDAPAIFPIGTTVVTWTATDDAGNSGTDAQNVTVTDTEAPTITAPADLPSVPVSPGSCSKAAVLIALGTPAVSDNCGSVTYTNDAPVSFPLGTTTVTWTATDQYGNMNTDQQDVTVIDNIFPTISAPPDVVSNTDFGVCTRALGNTSLGSPVASDNCPASITVTNDAPDPFPLGTTVVTWTVTDGSGHQATATQNVTIIDNTPPSITAPGPVVQAAPGGQCSVPAGSVALGSPTVSDNCGTLSPTNDAPTDFPVGITPVVWTVYDNSGNMSTAVQLVTITSDPPTITCPGNITADTDPHRPGAIVTYTPPVGNSGCPGSETVRIHGLGSGAFFPIGTTMEEYQVTDAVNRTATCAFFITVEDHENPTISVSLSPIYLWPANGTMQPIHAAVTTSDNAPGETWALTSITANENIAGDVAGATFNTADADFSLRAFRSSNVPRVYTVTFTATDASSNTATTSPTVTVPTSQPREVIFTDNSVVPTEAYLDQNYPNPFNPSTTIPFGMHEDGTARLTVLNEFGRTVTVIFNETLTAGSHTVLWNGTDRSGQHLPSGMYFYRLEANGHNFIRKMLLMQ